MLLVIDFSHWQQDPDPQALKNAGVVGIIHKCDELMANPQIDSEYLRRRKKYRNDNGFLWGAYCFEDGYDGAMQADLFLSVADDGATLLALDLERYANQQQAEQFVSRIYEKIGIWPVLYTRYEYIVNEIHATNSTVLANCPLWIADPNTPNRPLLPPPWKTWFLWQHGTISIGAVAVDRNWFDGTLEQLKGAWMGTITNSIQAPLVATQDIPAFKTPGGELHSWHRPNEVFTFMPDTKQTVNGVDYYAGPDDIWFQNHNIPAVQPPPTLPTYPYSALTTASVYFRKTPDDSLSVASRIALLAPNTAVTVTNASLGGVNNWTPVTTVLNGVTTAGYISGTYLKKA